MNIRIISLSFILISLSSCNLFNPNNSSRDASTLQGSLCSSDADCANSQTCSNGTCITDPNIGTECETDSDCGNTLMYNCNDGACEKIILEVGGTINKPSVVVGQTTCSQDSQCASNMDCVHPFTSLSDFSSQEYRLDTNASKTCKKVNGENCTTVTISEINSTHYSVVSISTECVSGFCDTDKKCGLKPGRLCSDYELFYNSSYRMCRSGIPCSVGGYNMCQ